MKVYSNVSSTSVLMGFFALLISYQGLAQPKWIRATYRDDPSTTISIGWSGAAGTLYYDTINHGTNYAAYANSKIVDRSTSHKSESHFFVRLINLQPATVYYFTVES